MEISHSQNDENTAHSNKKNNPPNAKSTRVMSLIVWFCDKAKRMIVNSLNVFQWIAHAATSTRKWATSSNTPRALKTSNTTRQSCCLFAVFDVQRGWRTRGFVFSKSFVRDLLVYRGSTVHWTSVETQFISTVCPTTLAPCPEIWHLVPKSWHQTFQAFQNIRPFVAIFNVDITRRRHHSQHVQRGSWGRHDGCREKVSDGR